MSMQSQRLRLAAVALLLTVAALPARAINYVLPGTLPIGCSASGSIYTCGALTMTPGDTISVAAPKPATLKINGAFDANNVVINSAGNASDLSIVVSGALTLRYQASLKANITAASVNDVDGQVVLGGSLAATSGSIALGFKTTVAGLVSSTTGAISLAQKVAASGGVSSNSGTVDLGFQTQVNGSISTNAAVTLSQQALVSGSVSSGSGAVNLGYQSQVNGAINSTASITLAQNSIVGGDINGGSGPVAAGFASLINGKITTSTGTMSFAQNSRALACVKSTGSASITLDYQSAVSSVCCGAGCSTSCVVNNSSAAMPPACVPSAIADFRFDACSYSGVPGEVMDSIGSNHATAILGATTGTGTPLVINQYGNLSYTDGRRYFAPVTAIALPSDWSVSSWVKFPLSTGGSQYHILGSMAGGGDILYLDGNANFRWGSYTPGSVVPGTFQLGTLSSGWHHVAVVGQGSTTSLYVDGSFKESVNAKATGSLAFIGASNDSDAGTHEGMNTAIDEYLVFNTALSASNVSTIRANQLAGKNYDGSSRAAVAACTVSPASFGIVGTGSASTCTPQSLTLTVKDSGGNTISGYTGTINLSTSTGRGDWSVGASPAPSGSLSPGSANSGLASYSFTTADNGTVKLNLSHSLAQDVVVTAVDSTVSASSTASAAITYRDNAFSFSEDSAGKISGSDVAVAGRPHDYTLTYLRKDPSTGACGPATDYTGSHALKLWRTDSSGSWTAPTVVSPALTIPAALPAANNLSLSFTQGVASFNLGSSDIGRYALNVRDDSLASAASIISGSSNPLTVRPFVVMVLFVKYVATQNPNGSAATDTVFAPAGASFGATVAAYTWAAAMLTNGADPNNTGTPAASASETAMKVGNRVASFASDVSLSPLAGSQTPVGGTLGGLNNGLVAGTGFSNGAAATSSLQYTEVGSFALNTSGVVSNFLGSGLALDAVVVNASGAQNTRVGRFVPAGFVVGSVVLTNRLAAACSPSSAFNHLDENFQFAFSLTAQNALGAKTSNYTGSFARLDLTLPANLGLAGIGGTTPFVSGGRLALASSSGSWVNGLASNVGLVAMAQRASAPDGPFDTAQFGIAPLDLDGVSMLSFNLDTSSPADGADRSLLATVPLRFGRLRLQNAIGSQTRPLRMGVIGQYWNGSAFVTNTLDSCTRITASTLSFGNFRKTLTSNDASLSNGPVTLSSGGPTYLTLAAPTTGRSGSYELAISLGGSAADASCLQSWTPGKPATAGASMAYLRGAWCSATYGKDPSARATFGLYRGNDATVYQRENY